MNYDETIESSTDSDSSQTAYDQFIQSSLDLLDDSYNENQTLEDLWLSSPGEEISVDVSPVFAAQTVCARQVKTGAFYTHGCDCGPRDTCRRHPSYPRCSIFFQRFQYPQSKTLRLNCWEAWKYQKGRLSSGDLGLSTQRGSISFDLWNDPTSFYGFTSLEVRHCCQNDQLWFIPGSRLFRNARLLLVKSEEDNRLSVFYFVEQKSSLQTCLEVDNPLSWLRPANKVDLRLVEYEFMYFAQIQTTTTLSFVSSQFFKDFIGAEANFFLECLSRPGRGLLRLLL